MTTAQTPAPSVEAAPLTLTAAFEGIEGAYSHVVLDGYAARRGRLLGKDHNRAEVAAITRQYRLGPLLYLIAFGLAFVSSAASVGVCAALAIYFALPGRK